MIITVDGLDGSGKSTLAKGLASRLGFIYIDKPIYQLFNVSGDDNILSQPIYQLQDAVYNKTDSDKLKAWFTGMSLLYIKEVMNSMNIVVDRGLLSAYAYNGSMDSEKVFQVLLDYGVWFDMSIFLYVSSSIRKQRLLRRNPNDPDLKIDKIMDLNYDSVELFMRNHRNLPLVTIDTDFLTTEEVLERAITSLQEYNMI